MKPFLAILLIFFGVCQVSGQVSFKVNLSEKHLSKVERTKDVSKKLKRYKKLMSKEEKRARREYADSLKRVAGDKVPYDSALVVSHLPDSSGRADSIAWALNTLAQYHEYDELQSCLENMDSVQIAELAEMELTPHAEQMARDYLPKDMGASSGGVESLRDSHLEALPFDPEAGPQELLPFDPKASPREQVESLQENLKGQELGKLQMKLSKLKGKYVSMPDLSNPDSGIKRNSLKGKPLKDRLYLGGNVVVQSTDPFVLDSDIQLGYKFNKDLVAGTGIRWRETFRKTDSLSLLSKDAHGYSLFIRQDLVKGIFVYAEYGAIRNMALFGDHQVKTAWGYEYLAGIGRKFSIAKFLELNILFLYDFNHRNNTTHLRPFVMRVGYGINKFPFK